MLLFAVQVQQGHGDTNGVNSDTDALVHLIFYTLGSGPCM